ncbi:MAG: hypothetical protein K2V38_22470, partial [Gemmataceae bacterium]|nr:hypothetical protein [Gemmataceae bacterium]
MSDADAPQVRRDRLSALAATGLACLALPTLALLVAEVPEPDRLPALFWLAGAVAGGALIPSVYWSRYRVLGFIPLAALGWLLAVGHGVYWSEWPGWAHGLPLGVLVSACVRGRRGPGPAVETSALAGVVLAGAVSAGAFVLRGRPFDAAVWFTLALAVALAGWSVVRLFRPWFELALEPVLWVMYAVRPGGPGFAALPRTGPCLVIANHACWLDPIFLAKVVGRPITPMMTSKFYDLPGLRRLMV